MEQSIKTVNDMMLALQGEIEDVKNGKLPESQARVVSTFRRHQLKLAELNLQFQRMNRGKKPETELLLLPTAG